MLHAAAWLRLSKRSPSVRSSCVMTWPPAHAASPRRNPFRHPRRAMSGFSQDWSPVVFSKKKPTTGTTVKDIDAVRCLRKKRKKPTMHQQPSLHPPCTPGHSPSVLHLGSTGKTSGRPSGGGQEMCACPPRPLSRNCLGETQRRRQSGRWRRGTPPRRVHCRLSWAPGLTRPDARLAPSVSSHALTRHLHRLSPCVCARLSCGREQLQQGGRAVQEHVQAGRGDGGVDTCVCRPSED